jgi:hypothetical protein
VSPLDRSSDNFRLKSVASIREFTAGECFFFADTWKLIVITNVKMLY